jgi:hypothetical protein
MSESTNESPLSLNTSPTLLRQLEEVKKLQVDLDLACTRIEEDRDAMEDRVQQLYKQTNELRQCLGL